MSDVALVDTGSANLESMRAALRRLEARPVAAVDAEDVRRAGRLVLPGVGAFGAAAGALRERGIFEALRERLRAGRPTLAVCLGMQLLARASEESPGVEGLGVVDAEVVALRRGRPLPHMGWNDVRGDDLSAGEAYFANSYGIGESAIERLRRDGWSVGLTEHGERFVSWLRRGAVLACQFHPEISGAWGEARLQEWLRAETFSVKEAP